MKPNLFDDPNIGPDEIFAALEGENCGVEHHTFIKAYTEDELTALEREFIEENKELANLQKELAALSAPIKEKIKPLEKMVKIKIKAINTGGEEVTEKVFCFPDYETKLMGLYDSRGILVGTRSMTRSERQLHINSHLQKAI